MIPVYQTWQKAEACVYLEKNHGGGGYFVDVQGPMVVKEMLKSKFDDPDEFLYCQWNKASNLSGHPGQGDVLTIRTRTQKIEGTKLLVLVGRELETLGYERIE